MTTTKEISGEESFGKGWNRGGEVESLVAKNTQSGGVRASESSRVGVERDVKARIYRTEPRRCPTNMMM